MKKRTLILGLCFLALFSACRKDDSQRGEMKPNVDDIPFYALTDNNRLDKYLLEQSQQAIASVAITGLGEAERMLAIDFRPATGQLYGVGSSSRLYVINPATGAARPVGMAPFTPALAGTIAGFDFNPTVDRIRLVTSTGQNLRLHPETGAVAMQDGAINGTAGAMITSVAYTNNEAGVTTTTLFDIDVATDKLYKQDPPNNGTLVEVGPLNLNLEGEGGFDIAPPVPGTTERALALYTQNRKSSLYTIDLATGRARKVEKFEKDQVYTGIAIPTREVAYAVSGGSLVIFNPVNPTATASKNITGLQPGETVLGIDFRPANGALYALGSSSRLYLLNPSNGAAMVVASLSIPLSGTSFGFDFNPVPDRIRIISNTGQNLRVNPVDGVAINDGTINPAPASVTAAGYTNSFAGAATTALYVIDSDNDMFYIQNPPNNGTLTEAKSLGVNIEAANGFDIGGASNMAYGIFTSGGASRVYRVNLMTGTAMPMGNFSSGVSGFALGLGF